MLQLDRSTVPADADGDDRVLPFTLERSALRGRLVTLGPGLEAIQTAHAYPEPVARLLAEALVLSALLGSTLKYAGIFTLQVKGDGPVPLLVADMTSDGALRGYAQFDPERLPEVREDGRQPRLERLTGQGYLAFTVDQGPDTERYQGIVALEGQGLVDSVRHYFRQSEQLETGVVTAMGRGADGRIRGAGMLLQRLPEGVAEISAEERQENWRRAMVLMQTASEAELLDSSLPRSQLLWRLFHEEGVRVHAHQPLEARCRCSVERIETILRSLPQEEVEGLKTPEGLVEVRCEFCSRRYPFSDADLARIYAEAEG